VEHAFPGSDSNGEDYDRGLGRGRKSGVRAVKGKNWVADEERQLARSVLAVSQDPIVGNQ
jgi:hypothetical protein